MWRGLVLAPALCGLVSAHLSWPSYHSNTELIEQWKKLADPKSNKYCPELNLTKEATTVDGWPLMTAQFGNHTGHKAKILIVFGIHGREYLGAEIGLGMMKRLCDGSDRSKKLLSEVSFKLFPLMNPSGRAGNLPEKKIKGEHNEPDCVLRRTNANGVDLNRNFDVDWDSVEGNSAEEGQVDWRGPSVASEIETKLLQDTGHAFKPDMFIDVHTGAFTQLTPFSYTTENLPAEDSKRLMDLVHHVQKTPDDDEFSTQPEAGEGSQLLYVATGTTMDYFFKKVKSPYAYTWETYDDSVEAAMAAARSGAAAVDLVTEPSWVPDMPQMRAYVERTRQRLATNPPTPEAAARLPRRATAALQPDAEESSPQVAPSQLLLDACFRFYNPHTPSTLEHYVNSWLDDLYKGVEYVVEQKKKDVRLGR